MREGIVGQMTFPYVPGADLAGVVENGTIVTAFEPGQQVFGRSVGGSYQVRIGSGKRSGAQARERLSFDEAAAIRCRRDHGMAGPFESGNLQPGQQILILGGAGGVGLFAVQFAHGRVHM